MMLDNMCLVSGKLLALLNGSNTNYEDMNFIEHSNVALLGLILYCHAH